MFDEKYGATIWNLNFARVDGDDCVVYTDDGSNSKGITMSRLRDKTSKTFCGEIAKVFRFR